MTKIREIYRLSFESKLSQRQVAGALRISRPVVAKYINLFHSSKLSYSEIDSISDEQLIEMLANDSKPANHRFQILSGLFEHFAKELKRTGVTLQRLWEEYREDHSDGYGYAQFCYYFKKWCKADNLYMHIEHKAAGRKLRLLLAMQPGWSQASLAARHATGEIKCS